ncbi:MAG: hypothetical protein LBD12_00240, partial [Clostridiales Family XIII bacterium]|nr:hypothetical protein [Clostridiales Family XIII bacterium]
MSSAGNIRQQLHCFLGKVCDAQTGEPVQGARVTVSLADSPVLFRNEFYTDQYGEYEVIFPRSQVIDEESGQELLPSIRLLYEKEDYFNQEVGIEGYSFIYNVPIRGIDITPRAKIEILRVKNHYPSEATIVDGTARYRLKIWGYIQKVLTESAVSQGAAWASIPDEGMFTYNVPPGRYKVAFALTDASNSTFTQDEAFRWWDGATTEEDA